MKNERNTSEFMKLLENALGDKKDWTDEQWAEHDAKIEKARRSLEPSFPEPNRHEILVAAGFPLRAIEAALADGAETHAQQALFAHDFTKRSAVVLSGPPGCGKTVATTAWAATKYGAMFLRASTFAASSRYDRDQRNQWLNARALVLDDLGGEYSDNNGSLRVDLDELIDIYYGDKRALVITTNLKGKAFIERYGERIADRLRECGRFISCKGESLRKRDA